MVITLKNRSRENRQRFIKVLFSRKIVIAAFIGVMIFIVCAVFAKWLSPCDPNATHPEAVLQNPSSSYWLGTDQFGRDTFSRLIYGARISLIIGVLAVSIACVVGVFLGLCAAYFGGWVDIVITRVCETISCIPSIMVSVALITILGHSISSLAVILSISTVPGYVRMMRGQALSAKQTDYVKSSEIHGASSLYSMFKHILPNTISPIIVLLTQQVGATILMESGLSYLGVGITIPTASWGTMVSNGKNYLFSNPVLALAPGLCVALLVICLNVLGDGIRDAMDPRLRGEL